MEDENKPQIIPKKVTDMANAIEKADSEGTQLIIIGRRQWGKTLAYRLARMTENATVIEPKQIENATIKTDKDGR